MKEQITTKIFANEMPAQAHSTYECICVCRSLCVCESARLSLYNFICFVLPFNIIETLILLAIGV